MKENVAIFVASSGDLTGETLISTLRNRGHPNLLNDEILQPNIRNLESLNKFFRDFQPEHVYLTAGKSGGIQANQEQPTEFMLDNLQVACTVFQAAYIHGVKRLLYLASSCVYPRLAAQPLRPEMLMMGHLEPTNASYAMAKLAGIELCRAYKQQYGAGFFSVIPANVFGPGDVCNDKNSHVIDGLIRKMYQARKSDASTVEIWGSGRPYREFIYVDDLVDACLFLMDSYCDAAPINIGTGHVVSIGELADLIKGIVGYRGILEFNLEQPDGMPSKLLDSTPLFNMGWRPQFELETGIQLTFDRYLKQSKLMATSE